MSNAPKAWSKLGAVSDLCNLDHTSTAMPRWRLSRIIMAKYLVEVVQSESIKERVSSLIKSKEARMQDSKAGAGPTSSSVDGLEGG